PRTRSRRRRSAAPRPLGGRHRPHHHPRRPPRPRAEWRIRLARLENGPARHRQHARAGSVARAPGRSHARGSGARRMSTELLEIGDTAPAFEAPASDGKTYALARLISAQAVVLVFYPGNNTPG